MIHFRWHDKVCQLRRIQQFGNFLTLSLILTNIVSSLLWQALSVTYLIMRRLPTFVNSPCAVINRIMSLQNQLRIPRHLSLIFQYISQELRRSSPCDGFELFRHVATFEHRHGICCGFCCFEASTESGNGIQMEDQVYITEVQIFQAFKRRGESHEQGYKHASSRQRQLNFVVGYIRMQGKFEHLSVWDL